MWSFEGIGTFMNGVLNGGPLVIQWSDQRRSSYSYIKQGKPYCVLRSYHSDGYKKNVKNN